MINLLMKIVMVALLLVSSFSMAEIYRWTDGSGRVHFGDAPPDVEASEKIHVQVNSYKNISYEKIEFYQPVSSKRVIMYSTSWCAYCKKARAYFDQNNIAYVECDIEKDKKAKREYDRLGGKGVPVILIDKTKMTGFSVAGFNRLYQ